MLGPGFLITAGPSVPLPAGTVIDINGTGVANIGVFTPTPNIATVTVLGGTSRRVTLGAALPAGSTLALRTTLSLSVLFTLSAKVTLPTGYVSTGGKSTATVNSTLVLCSAT